MERSKIGSAASVNNKQLYSDREGEGENEKEEKLSKAEVEEASINNRESLNWQINKSNQTLERNLWIVQVKLFRARILARNLLWNAYV